MSYKQSNEIYKA